MPLQTWLGFVLTAGAVIAVPGPTVMLIVGTALAAGERAALCTVAGVALGDATAITIVFAGLDTLLTTEPRGFVALQWAGAAYLLWLGVRLWLVPRGPARPPSTPAACPAASPAANSDPTSAINEGPPARVLLPMVARGWLVTILNPKGLLFFAALMPQFVDRADPATPQMVTLGGTHVVLAAAILAFYVRLSGRMRRIAAASRSMRAGRRIAGAVLIAAAAYAAWPAVSR